MCLKDCTAAWAPGLSQDLHHAEAATADVPNHSVWQTEFAALTELLLMQRCQTACAFAGTATSYMGMSLIHDLSDIPLSYWLGPALAVTGGLLVCGLVLEARKYKVCAQHHADDGIHAVMMHPAWGFAAGRDLSF